MPGTGHEVKGTVKEFAGKVLNNEQMQAEGKAERLAGKAERETAGAVNQAVGTVKREAGEIAGNKRLQIEGEAQRLKGKAQQMG